SRFGEREGHPPRARARRSAGGCRGDARGLLPAPHQRRPRPRPRGRARRRWQLWLCAPGPPAPPGAGLGPGSARPRRPRRGPRPRPRARAVGAPRALRGERENPLWATRDWAGRAFTVGIGGPVGSGKTALTLRLCQMLRDKYSVGVVTNDIFTREDCEFLTRNGALPPERILAVETGGCPHAAIREDITSNVLALEDHGDLTARHPGIQLLICESGGDNLAANFSRELSDYTVYVIDVAGGDKEGRAGHHAVGLVRGEQDRPGRCGGGRLGGDAPRRQAYARRSRGRRCSPRSRTASEWRRSRGGSCRRGGSPPGAAQTRSEPASLAFTGGAGRRARRTSASRVEPAGGGARSPARPRCSADAVPGAASGARAHARAGLLGGWPG
ncbi:unnamed protein product, partial [Prorocentrum cordatum]